MFEMWLRINNKYFLLIKSYFFGVKVLIFFLFFKKCDYIKVYFYKKKLCICRNKLNMNVYFKIII